MNCEKCQDLLSDYVDGHLSADDRRELALHIDECVPCYSVSEDLDAIVDFCRENRGSYDPVPNSRAMWVRIRNTVESERAALEAAVSRQEPQGTGFWSRIGTLSWQLSFTQLIATVSAIAIVVSIITTASLRHMGGTTSAEQKSAIEPTVQAETVTDLDSRTSQQQMDINYWNQRVEQRKSRWSPQIRDAFERNLSAVDQAVNDSRRQLMQNPHDEISEEMLNAAMDEKKELLKDFSDQ
jgi:hypothetical protein